MKNFKLYLLLLVFYSSDVYSDIEEALVSHITWVQKRADTPLQCKEEVNSPKNKKKNIAELCVSQICGPSQDVKTPEELADDLMFNPLQGDDIWGHEGIVRKEINTLLDEADRERLLSIKSYKNLKKRNELSPEPEALKIHNWRYLMFAIGNYGVFKSGPNLKLPIILDRKETLVRLKEKANFSEKQNNWIVSGIDRNFRSSTGIELILQGSFYPEQLMKLKYPKLDFAAAITKESLKMEKLANEILKKSLTKVKSVVNSIPGSIDVLTDPLIKKASAGGELSSAEVSVLMSRRQTILFLNDFVNKQEMIPLGKNEEQFSERLKRVGFDKQLKVYENDLLNDAKKYQARSVVLETCFTNYLFQMATLPKQDQLSVADKHTQWAKNKTKTLFGPKFSKKTVKSLNNKINQTFFNLPMSRESFHSHFMSKIKSEISDLKKSSDSYQTLISSHTDKTTTLLQIESNLEDYNINSHFESASDFCKEFKVSYLSDNLMSSTGSIETSWYAVREPEAGKAIMLHELGHIVYDHINSDISSNVSKKKIEKISKCLEENHPGDDHLPAESYVEEDWSDLLASVGAPQKNIGCTVTDQDNNNKYSDLQLVNTNLKDSHSMGMFRAIHSHKVINQSLPSACTQYIEGEKHDWKFNSCF